MPKGGKGHYYFANNYLDQAVSKKVCTYCYVTLYNIPYLSPNPQYNFTA